MDVTMYFNQLAKYEEYSNDDNTYNVEEYKDPIEIKVRVEGVKRFIRNDKDGSVTVSEHVYYTKHPVKVKDRIEDQYIKSVKPIYWFDGSIVYYEAYL